MMNTIWVCIPVHNRVDYTLRCLSSFQRQSYSNFKIVLCDDGSTDGSSAKVKKRFPETIVLNGDGNLWWAGATNKCVEYALKYGESDDYILTINNDTEVPKDYLKNVLDCARQVNNSIITSVIYDIKTRDLVSVGFRQNWFLARVEKVNFIEHHLQSNPNLIEVTHASGRGTLYPLAVFKEIGLYDEKHLPQYAADYDFSHRARRAGYPIFVSSTCKVYSYVDETGLTSIRSKISLRGFKEYLFGIKSPASLNARWWLAWNNCPKLLLPSYMIIDIVRVIGSYFKHFLSQARS